MFWGVDANTGAKVWGTLVGPGSSLGGLEWGSATDGQRIYFAVVNLNFVPYTMVNPPKGTPAMSCAGSLGLVTGGVARTALGRAANEAETLARQGRIAERLSSLEGKQVDFEALEAAELRNAGQRFVQGVEEEVVEVVKGWKTGGGGSGPLGGGGW